MSTPSHICSMTVRGKYVVLRAVYAEKPVIANFTSPSAVGTTWGLQVTLFHNTLTNEQSMLEPLVDEMWNKRTLTRRFLQRLQPFLDLW